MSFDVDADPCDLRRMSDRLAIFASNVDVAGREIAHLFQHIEWDDSRFEEFRSEMQPVVSMLADAVSQAKATKAYIDEKASILEAYLGGR